MIVLCIIRTDGAERVGILAQQALPAIGGTRAWVGARAGRCKGPRTGKGAEEKGRGRRETFGSRKVGRRGWKHGIPLF